MRLFVAAYPSPAALADLAAYVARLSLGRPAGPGQSLRLVPAERWHLTLAFLGELPDRRFAAAVAATAAAAHQLAQLAAADERAGVPVLRLAGGGRFGRGRSTIIWTGLRGDLDGLDRVARTIRRHLKAARLPFDPKPFRPHLTLARPGDRLSVAEIDADLAALREYEGPKWTVHALALVSSQIGPAPVHQRVAEWSIVDEGGTDRAAGAVPEAEGRPAVS